MSLRLSLQLAISRGTITTAQAEQILLHEELGGLITEDGKSLLLTRASGAILRQEEYKFPQLLLQNDADHIVTQSSDNIVRQHVGENVILIEAGSEISTELGFGLELNGSRFDELFTEDRDFICTEERVQIRI